MDTTKRRGATHWSRRKVLGTALAAGGTVIARPMIGRADAKSVLIAEPVHGMGYLPLYVGMAKNLFDDVTVNLVTIEIRRRSHQCGALGPGLRLYRRTGARRLCQGQGRRTALGRELRRSRQCLFLRRQRFGADQYRLGGLFQRQGHRLRALWRHAELDHALSPQQVEARCQDRRDAGRDGQLGDHAGGEKRPGSDRQSDRAVHHPRHSRRRLGRTILQHSKGARAIRLFDLQCTARTRSRRSRSWYAASFAA